MKILVAVKRVIDAEMRVRPDAAGRRVDGAGLKMAMNPYDENAVEAAARMIEKGIAQDAVIVSIGPAAAAETIRTALAMGGSSAVLVKCDATLEPQAIAKILKTICDEERPDLVLCGQQAIDDEAGQVPSRLAGLLDWPQAVGVSEMEMENGWLRVACETEGGRMRLSLPLPAVIGCDLRLNQPRFASLPRLIQAKKKPIRETTPEALGVDTAPRIETLAVSEPPPRPPGITVSSVADFIKALEDRGVLP